ncbi:MAG: aromatic ring-hydroxylating dioxygenase subunit alpha [Geminicoccaceae bacterium]
MSAATRMLGLLAARRPDFSLQREFYTDPELYALEVDEIWHKGWIFVGLSCEIPEPGRWMKVDIASESAIVLRGRDGAIRAFHNVCRHRGARICLGEKGRAARLVCSYHQWSYDLDGRLAKARHMGEDFDPSAFALKPIAIENVGGWLFLSLADEPPPIEDFRRDVLPFLLPVEIDRCKVAFESSIVEEGNWKLVMENNRECYHCAGSHPELCETLAEYDAVDDPRADPEFGGLLERKYADWTALGLPYLPTPHHLRYRAVRLPYIKGALAMTMDGKLASTKLLGKLTDPDLGSVRMLSLPNSWNHLGSDHVVTFRVLPLSPTQSLVTTKWLVHADAVEGVDYDVTRLTEVWTATNDQDRHLVEITQAGVSSKAYVPGPYSGVIEVGVRNFVDWYCGEMTARLQTPGLAIAAE